MVESGKLVGDTIIARYRGDFMLVPSDAIEYIDVAPSQMVGVSAGLIPFLEHDDANRALMGSNMQRQGVPLLISESPLVGTGLEAKAARDSRSVIVAEGDGIVAAAGWRYPTQSPAGHFSAVSGPFWVGTYARNPAVILTSPPRGTGA
jgi:DNA-directed RNA polymerase subunit beta